MEDMCQLCGADVPPNYPPEAAHLRHISVTSATHSYFRLPLGIKMLSFRYIESKNIIFSKSALRGGKAAK